MKGKHGYLDIPELGSGALEVASPMDSHPPGGGGMGHGFPDPVNGISRNKLCHYVCCAFAQIQSLIAKFSV
jgi:hypothetical protein